MADMYKRGVHPAQKADEKDVANAERVLEPFKRYFVIILQRSVKFDQDIAAARNKNASIEELKPLIADAVHARKLLKIMLRLFIAAANVKHYFELEAGLDEEMEGLLQYCNTLVTNYGPAGARSKRGFIDASRRIMTIGNGPERNYMMLAQAQKELAIDLQKQFVSLCLEYSVVLFDRVQGLNSKMGVD